jgi:superfamily II DNA or RNA helicase
MPRKTSLDMPPWPECNQNLAESVARLSEATLNAYRAQPALVEEHANIELAASEGGYSRRQIYELIQNGADALIGAPGGKVHVALTNAALYCANEGAPIDENGIKSLLLSNVSQKRGDEIGRFGLGFKSVTEVTTSPQFFSRSASFGWDADHASILIREATGVAGPYPTLRLARQLDPDEEAASDPLLAELMTWATTIVKLPFDDPMPSWISDDVREFPGEFLLFSKHVGTLVLEQRGNDETVARTITLTASGDEATIAEDGTETAWKVFSCIHETSQAAREDAGTMSNRDRVPIHWAVKLSGPPVAGHLWAFFKSDYETTLSGIVNAPWRTNPDRRHLLEGEFNREILERTAELVVENLPKIVIPDDPGAFLELLPGRGREVRNWADKLLGDEIFERAASAPSLPDLNGDLRIPSDLTMLPEAIPLDLLESWESFSPSRSWVHPRAQTNDTRKARVSRLITAGHGRVGNLKVWLEALVPEPTATNSAAALRIAASCVEADAPIKATLEEACIALTDNGALVPASPTQCFLPSDYTPHGASHTLAPELADDESLRDVLALLGLTAFGARPELEQLLSRRADLDDEGWETVWRLIRSVGFESAEAVAQACGQPYVRTRTHDFVPIHVSLLPGPVIPPTGERDGDVLIDTEFHRTDVDFLEKCGAVAAPTIRRGSLYEEWFKNYRNAAKRAFKKQLKPGENPIDNLLDFRSTHPFSGPLEPMLRLSDDGRIAFTAELLDSEPHLDQWSFGHRTQLQYGEIDWDPPAIWMIKDKGRFRTTQGSAETAECVGPSLRQWGELLPVAQGCTPIQAAALGMADELRDVRSELRADAFARCADVSPDLTGAFYAAAAEAEWDAPSKLAAVTSSGIQLAPPGKVAVTSVPDEFTALVASGTPAIRAPNEAATAALVQLWGILPSTVEVDYEIGGVALTEPEPIRDVFPALRAALTGEAGELVIHRHRDLTVTTSTTEGTRSSMELEIHFAGSDVYCDASVDDRRLLELVQQEFRLPLDPDSIEAALGGRKLAVQNQLVLGIRDAETDELRVVEAIGADAIVRNLPDDVASVLDSGDAAQIGMTALAIHGYDVLKEFRLSLAQRGLNPPDTWAGSTRALEFVHELGFPREFAGFRQTPPSAYLEVEGPVELRELHPYQKAIADNIRLLLADGSGGRGLVSLPTGAGKTRVAVEALVAALGEGQLSGPVLWVAQSEELCEQAVRAWTEIWRSTGPPSPLGITRLWASNGGEALDNRAHVVVATIDKLITLFDSDQYAWLSTPSCIVIDEAHGATAQSYTRLLAWTGNDSRKRVTPIIGLTATPFRGFSESENRALAARFDKRRLDEGILGDDPYGELQSMGVLAQADHITIVGTDITLKPDELKLLETMKQMPRQAEARLGHDAGRNERILDAILDLGDDVPTILYCNSVEHTRTMAAFLALRGVAARPVTGETESAARRRYIDAFKAGELTVLTNYQVLTQGFDAPAVEAIVIARPVYSPNLYQQIVGRGLRGPLNGGKERCTIVNVEDNVHKFGEALAFRGFEHLWRTTEVER